GYRTVLVEKYNTLGGTCTNVGCIPTKALLDSTHHYSDALKKFEYHGINIGDVKLDFEQMFLRKAEVVLKNTEGLEFLMKKNKITRITGTASFVDNSVIKITSGGGEQQIKANHFIIATGSKPASLPGINIDKERIITSTEALSLKELPKSMVIIGGGVIGVEMASIFNRLGT
ncbi:FAD-dependent oxidoreductase, partial [Chryseobacterium indologenes]